MAVTQMISIHMVTKSIAHMHNTAEIKAYWVSCYLQHSPTCKCFDLWGVDYYLFRWVSVSFLAHFKLARRTANFIALLTATHCFDLTLLDIINKKKLRVQLENNRC